MAPIWTPIKCFLIISPISLALTHSAPATLASLLFLNHDKLILDSELLLYLCSL